MTDVVPSVDLCPFIAGGADGKHAVAQAIKQACEEIGFFKIRGHGVPQALVERAFATADAFFADREAELRVRNNHFHLTIAFIDKNL